MQDDGDISQIVRSYLTGVVDDVTLAALVQRVVAFYKTATAEAANLRDGSNGRPHYSLRTLCRALLHIRACLRQYGLDRAVHDGFFMNFVTLLDERSALSISTLINSKLLGPKPQAGFRNLPSACPPGCIPILEFLCPLGPLAPQEPANFIMTASVTSNIRNILRALVSGKFPVLLQGPTSSGKTSMVEYLVGHRFLIYYCIF